jgi:hypothetical protein
MNMIFEISYQVRVGNIEEGRKWYETLLKKAPDFIPHEDFFEWEIIPGTWLQVSEGTPAEGSGPLRFGVKDIEAEREIVVRELKVEPFEVFSLDGVPVKWGTFSDPWGNQIGYYEFLNKEEEQQRIETILGQK